MGAWNTFLSIFGLGDEEPSEQKSSKANRPAKPLVRRKGPSPGDVFRGRVDYIDKRFAKVVSSGGHRATVFIDEIADHFIESASEELRDGQDVSFVLVKDDPRGWTASIIAVKEARTRKALSKLKPGERISGKVIDIMDSGVVLDADPTEVWIPIDELSWEWIGHPSDAIALGCEVEVEILRVELPEGWLTDKRNRCARAVGSLRACVTQPESPQIPVAFSSLPFKVWATAKTPRSCDSVVLYVLEDLVEGRSRESIATTTGLPGKTLDRIHDVLAEEKLVKGWKPRAKGKRLAEAVSLARKFNTDPIRKLFASAAPPNSKFVSVEEQRAQGEYPPDWPRPPFNKPLENELGRAIDESLPEPLLKQIVTDEKRFLLEKLQGDDQMRVFLRRDGSHSRKPVYIDTPEHWFLAGLWVAFEPCIEKPFRPANNGSRCRNFLLVRCHLFAQKDGKPLDTWYFEPYTATLWRLKNGEQVFENVHKGTSFPQLPALGKEGVTLATGDTAKRLLPDSWCSVGVR